MGLFSYFLSMGPTSPGELSWHDYLRSCAVDRGVLDGFLSGPGWARFDPELGYVLRDSAIPWGVDGTLAVETFDEDGGRGTLRYPGRRPRINCYGDEFTEGVQVNDGETWQEYLSAHLREPVGNYGVGGYGVYQAYRRLVREERGRHPARVLVLGVTGLAMVRSVTRSQWVAMAYPRWEDLGAGLPIFHGNPWPNLELELSSGVFIERENPLRTPASLDRMTDPEWMVEAFRDDHAARLLAFGVGLIADLAPSPVERLAELLGTRFDWGGDRCAEALRLVELYGQAATNEVLDRARDFAELRGARLLVVLDFSTRISAGVTSEPRDDERVLDHLARGGFSVLDMNDVHRREFSKSTLTWDEYLAEIMVPGNEELVHDYNARGNHFLAYAVKDAVLPLLEQKPRPYRVEPTRAAPPATRPPGHIPDLDVDEDWIIPVLAEVRERFAEPWSVDSLTRLAHKSRSAFYRDFLAVMKLSPMEYIRGLRLDEAARLLATTDATVAAVAQQVGLSPFYLSREFTRRFGVAASEYRRTHRVRLIRGA